MTKCSNVQSITAEDIPLRDAILTATGVSPRVYPIIIKVVRHPITETGGRPYDCTYGANSIWYQLGTREERLWMLSDAKRILVDHYQVQAKLVDDALSVIPEYRRAIKRGPIVRPPPRT
jgi:hypothetical protein